MAALNNVFTQALIIVQKNGKGLITKAANDYFEVDYDNVNQMISEAQLLNHLGYTTQINRDACNMCISV